MRVAIFTGSAVGTASHAEGAGKFARELAHAGAGIVYGGGRAGLMGTVADAALAAGGEVIGVMPRHLVDQEIAHEGLTRLDVVSGMHERKARMAELADAFAALPGGAGTMEELFEAWTWGQLGLHAKPVALLDIDGFYRPLIEQLKGMSDAGYLGQAHLRALGVVSTAAGFLRFVASYRQPPRKWAPAAGTTLDAAAGQVASQNGTALTSVGWLCVREGHMLAVRSHGRDRFYLPGGKPEVGESPEQAIMREVREELSVDLINVRTAFTVRAPAHGLADGTVLTMHCFYGDHVGDPRPAREIAELAWLGPADARAAPAVREVFHRLGN